MHEAPKGTEEFKAETSWVLKRNCPLPDLTLDGKIPGLSDYVQKTISG